MLTQSGAHGHVIGWTNFSHKYSIHGFCQHFNISMDLFTVYFAHFSEC